MKWTPDLMIAAFIIVACVVMIMFGINSEVKSIFGISAGWVFGTCFIRISDSRRG